MNLYSIFFISSFLIGIDAVSKILASHFLIGSSYQVIPHILSLRYVENIGIAFSFPIHGITLKVLTLILIFGIIGYYFFVERKNNSLLGDISFTLIISGALGNAWERIFQGFVVDFIELHHFAVCNLADCYISLGALGIIYISLKKD